MSLESFQASLVLSCVGNSIGNCSSEEIGKSGEGLSALEIFAPKFLVEEDIVLSLATAEALAVGCNGHDFMNEFASRCAESMADLKGRKISNVVLHRISELQPGAYENLLATFNANNVSCCAAVRAVSIGLRYHKPNNVDELIAASIESTRMIHNNPIAWLGALTTALFTSFAIQERDLREWGAGLLAALPLALEYVITIGRNIHESGLIWHEFEDRWKGYLMLRGILDGEKKPKFPKKYDAVKRNKFYTQFSLPGLEVGESAVDATIIAYDALLYSDSSWSQLCQCAMLHNGHGGASGAIAATWWGVIHGFSSVPSCNYQNVEFKDRFVRAATKIYSISL